MMRTRPVPADQRKPEMTAATSGQLVIDVPAREFLKRCHAEKEFETTAEVLRECLPELRSIGVGLWEDPDLDDRGRVVLRVTLPASHPLDLLQDQRRHLAQRLVKRLPPAQYPNRVCALTI